ncbi:dTDP-glucose 4,6-dehydratase, partial [Verrucomicrobia bacterium]|nr:dTDP-glucose 4,6-dehydratase [Verrucomicrobiota bacterium]
MREINGKNILVTGGAGFIGSHLVTHLVKKYDKCQIINFDKLTYAGNLNNLIGVEKFKNYKFINGDICEYDSIKSTFNKYNIDIVINLAAESHVDRSIEEPFAFAETNVIGTLKLLEAAKNIWNNDYTDKLFYHISTDEVFGSLDNDHDLFTELSHYDPSSSYSASKASSDHFVGAYYRTFDLPIVISNCSNNYGPYQYPEKLIPVIIDNALNNRSIPIYGDGSNVRDWLFVSDHISAMECILMNSPIGESYNIGGGDEMKNIDLVRTICDLMDEKVPSEKGKYNDLIAFVKDRPGHDYRYAIDSSKIKNKLGWEPEFSIKKALSITIDWYKDNQEW